MDVEALDKKHVLHPWAVLDEFQQSDSILVDQGEGCYVSDIDGKKYIDGIGGLWCVNVGYGRQEIVDAAAEQTRRLAYYSSFVSHGTPPMAVLAARLAEVSPRSLNHVFFTTGGSTANDTAIRLIQNYNHRRGKPEKHHIISRGDAYHGSTYLSIQLIGKEPDKVGFRFDVPWVHHVDGPNLYRRPEGTSESEWCDLLVERFEKKILSIGPENVAAFFAEPVQAAGGVKFAPPGYHKRMHEVCRKYDVLWVSDEVVTGFGRLGHWFAIDSVFGVEPDIITCAKGLTSGYAPLGAAIISDEIHEVLAQPSDHMLSNGFTYGGHPVACAVALANMKILEEEKIFEHVREVGPYFVDRMSTLADLPFVGDVRGMDFVHGIEFVKNKASKELLPQEVDVGERIVAECMKRGAMVRPIAHLNVISPPLVMTKGQVDEFVQILHESIVSVAGELEQEGFGDGQG